MGLTPTWRATITTAGLVFDRPKDYQAYLNRLGGYGEDVDVIVRKHKAQRSSKQLRWLRGVAVPLIADELGWDRQDRDALYYHLLAQWGGTRKDEKTGFDIPNVPHGSALTTAQFAELQDWVMRWAMTEHGIYVPAPNEVDIEEYQR